MESKTCPICGSPFTPNKYSPKQKICSDPSCQKKRQLASMKVWREQHPTYFKYDESKGPAWLEIQRRRSKSWRERNPEKVRAYRQTHLGEYREYMRSYMRQYREQKKAAAAAPLDSGAAPNAVNPGV